MAEEVEARADARAKEDVRAELRRQIERVRPDTEAFAAARPVEAPGLERSPDHHRVAAPAERLSFGRWLLGQADRRGLIGTLAAAAAADRAFPRDGDVAGARDHLREMRADGDMFEALDDAELDWASL